jgi:hypothetical protein
MKRRGARLRVFQLWRDEDVSKRQIKEITEYLDTELVTSAFGR